MIKGQLLKILQSNTCHSDVFRHYFKIELAKIIESSLPDEDLTNILTSSDILESCKQLVHIAERNFKDSKLFKLQQEIKKTAVEKDIAAIIKNGAHDTQLRLNEHQFLATFTEEYLDGLIENHIVQYASFERLLSNIAQTTNYNPDQCIKKLLEREDTMYYLSISRKEIDKPYKMLFSTTETGHSEYTEYISCLPLLCGFLHIYDLRVN